jgi:multidrug efflux pump subunit AcrA (membrane-fusion protein)
LPTRFFAAAPRSDNGLVMMLERPRRAPDILMLAGAFYGQAAHRKKMRRWNWAGMSKWAAAAVILICIGLVPIPDGAQVSATVEPVNRRIVTAPLNTTLKKLEVEDGDVVAQGDPLVQLDVQDIELELISLKAERTSAVLDRETARASNSAATLRNAELEVERLSSRIALSEYKLGFAVLRAPISGVVIIGDLDGRFGATLRSGQDLLQISNPDDLYLELLVREAEIGKFTQNDGGLFRPDFDPSLRIPVRVGVLSPALDLTGVVPVARAKATFNEAPPDLRPGVRGVVLVGEQDRAIWRVLYTALRDWVLLRFWL